MLGELPLLTVCPLPNLLDLETLRHPTLPRYGTDYYLVNETTSRSVYQIVNGDAQQVDIAVNQMRWMPFIPQENLNSNHRLSDLQRSGTKGVVEQGVQGAGWREYRHQDNDLERLVDFPPNFPSADCV